MKTKYIDEKYKPYFIFGSSEKGKVDVCDEDKKICTVTEDEAKKIIEDREKVLILIHGFNEIFPMHFKHCFEKAGN